MELFIAKIASSVLAVLALSFIAERVSPRAGGIMAGYPLGTAIALFFIGLENGLEFATDAALYTLPGFVAAMMLAAGYFVGLKTALKPRVLISTIVAMGAFGITSFLLKLPSYNIYIAVFIPMIAIPVFTFAFRRIENTRVGRPVKTTATILLIRATAAAAMVLIITGVASAIGPVWSGLLAAFPVSMVPFLIMMHLTYGENQALTIIKNYPAGLGALVVYTLTVYLCYKSLGVAMGTLLSFATATVYLIMYASILKSKEVRAANM
ncbi:hypothetical protein [Curvivirga aplysinae]|uniref:hypothetical protein n=1 Tax=Curvivirga aplysinae TaxID=2529852 RepID=UPI0012BD3E5C|nr:hypothetical protein [Curvivirga aplysinae]MTI10633.1 hypothetical protein [Curvivirga aplysinae]